MSRDKSSKALAPVVTKTPAATMGSSRTRHPAFAMIGAARVTYGRDGTYLYGSDFTHRQAVQVTIRASEHVRGLSGDSYFADLNGHYITVLLSESQWAAFVSSLNMGDGVPCTVTHRGHERVPDIAGVEEKAATFRAEMHEAMADQHKAAGELLAAINRGAGKGELRDIAYRLKNAAPNVEFVAKQFGEHVEDTVNRAKQEVGAYTMSAVQRAGLEALHGRQRPPVELPGPEPVLLRACDGQHAPPRCADPQCWQDDDAEVVPLPGQLATGDCPSCDGTGHTKACGGHDNALDASTGCCVRCLGTGEKKGGRRG